MRKSSTRFSFKVRSRERAADNQRRKKSLSGAGQVEALAPVNVTVLRDIPFTLVFYNVQGVKVARLCGVVTNRAHEGAPRTQFATKQHVVILRDPVHQVPSGGAILQNNLLSRRRSEQLWRGGRQQIMAGTTLAMHPPTLGSTSGRLPQQVEEGNTQDKEVRKDSTIQKVRGEQPATSNRRRLEAPPPRRVWSKQHHPKAAPPRSE